MNAMLLCLGLLGQVSIDLDVGPLSSGAAWARPAVTCANGESYSLTIGWGDATNFYWQGWSTNVCDVRTHTFSDRCRVHEITLLVKSWDRLGQVLPDKTVTKIVTTPPPIVVSAMSVHGAASVDLSGGVGPYLVTIYGNGCQTFTVQGSFCLPLPPGGYMILVSGATRLANGLVVEQPDHAGCTVCVMP